jgi:NAD(P)-dependent dehydrogenase (short-subunit alcohol dehydrogenase family)
MEIAGKVVVVTGGGRGIGKALCEAFSEAGAGCVVVADLDASLAEQVAAAIGGVGLACDVTDEAQIQRLVATVEQQVGPIDIFCSNAGIALGDDAASPIASCDNTGWQQNWAVHVMSHVYAARAVVPGMIARGGGYLVNTASAAGLLQQVGDSAYSTTKHAAVGFAEAMAIAHGDQGIGVSVVCPQYVATRMIGVEEGQDTALGEGVITPQAAADVILEGIRQEQFLVLTHPEVKTFWERKFSDYNRWLAGMRRLRKALMGDGKTLKLDQLHK